MLNVIPEKHATRLAGLESLSDEDFGVGRRWLTVIDDADGERPVFDVFLASSDESGPAVRTLVWPAKRTQNSLFEVAEECFQSALEDSSFSFSRGNQRYALNLVLDEGGKSRRRSATPGQPREFSALVERASSRTPCEVHFGRFDVVDRMDRGIAFTVTQIENEDGHFIEYAVALEWPLQCSSKLISWAFTWHCDPSLSTRFYKDSSRLSAILNRRP